MPIQPESQPFKEESSSILLMRRTLFMLLFMVIWLAVTAATLTWGFNYNWPDNVHVDYGLPLTWATNTTSTIVGPVNLWSVNLFNLLVDLVFWLGIMIAAIAAIFYKFEPQKPRNKGSQSF